VLHTVGGRRREEGVKAYASDVSQSRFWAGSKGAWHRMTSRSLPVHATGLVTIVSANYVPAARVLCRSFKEFHPDARCFVVVVDRPFASAVRKEEPFEPIDVADIGIPGLEDLLAQYTILEANTAVKPFVLRHLFERYPLEQVVYLDPDIWVLGPLASVFEALRRNSIVLTPHMRDPFRDDARPREADILRSGIFNLGFIALRRGPSASRLLKWWSDKTECDCVVDFENGLFVDQKWMDLVPGYFEDVEILRSPGYNVAYWNLHERNLTLTSGGRYFAAEEPVAFFHFSGFDPSHPSRLSKHQDRHHPKGNAVLLRLCREYTDKLLAEGYDRARQVPYGFDKLRNGIPVSSAIRKTVRYCRKNDIPFPSVEDADAFCRFMMTPNSAVAGRDLSPFANVVLQIREDVAAVYPTACDDAEDPGFLNWMLNSAHEMDSTELHSRFGKYLTRLNPFVRIERLYASRPDLKREFPEAFATLEGFDPFASWLRRYGVQEEDLDEQDVTAFVEGGRTGFSRVLEYYLASPVVASEFPFGLLPWSNADFFDWMLRYGVERAGISATDLLWFQHRAQSVPPEELLLLTALRGHFLRLQSPLGSTVVGWSDLCKMARLAATSRGATAPALPIDPPNRIPGVVQLETLHAESSSRRAAPDAFRSTAGVRDLADDLVLPLRARLTDQGRSRLLAPIANFRPARGVNVAGHFHYAAGSGIAAHALVRALDAAGIVHQDVTLPVNPSRMCGPEAGGGAIPDRFWALHRPDYEVSITVANADTMPAARAFLGPCWDRNRKHIAHWVWETAGLPGHYAPAADGLDAIWTPSEFSARGLRATLPDVRVEVVPYSISTRAIEDLRPLPIALPENVTLFGFFFDARSVLERKNPKAVIAAFRSAFRDDEKVALVLKVNNARAARRDVIELERLAEGLPVIWLRDVRLDEFQQRTLLSKLDVFVSLHRSEGFGMMLAEAMGLGRAVIATRYSGNMQFMDDSTSLLIGAREVVTEQSHGPYPRGTRWAEPDLEEAVAAMRRLHRDVEERRHIGERARAHVEKLLAPRVIGKQIAKLLDWNRTEDAPRTESAWQFESQQRTAGVARDAAAGRAAAPDNGSDATLGQSTQPRLWPAE
jgi:glycosyltransferase involved in cell wall biosynthesis